MNAAGWVSRPIVITSPLGQVHHLHEWYPSTAAMSAYDANWTTDRFMAYWLMIDHVLEAALYGIPYCDWPRILGYPA